MGAGSRIANSRAGTGGSRPQPFLCLPQPLVPWQMCCQLLPWLRDGRTHYRTMDNYRTGQMMRELVYQIRTGEFSRRNGLRCNTEGLCDREVILNAISLACGFFGNFCLLLNFTRRVRYIVALPATIISWYFATSIVSVLYTHSG